MRRYKKKPIIIVALQYNGSIREMIDYVGEDNVIVDTDKMDIYIKTLEGNMKISHGDYVIRGLNNEFYPCKPDIFLKTYDPL